MSDSVKNAMTHSDETPRMIRGGEVVHDANSRRFRRISVGLDHTIRFRLGGLELDRVPIANLSAGGCFAILDGHYHKRIHQGMLLMDFVLEHADLPSTPICSQVVRVVPGLTELTESDLGLGIAFLSTSPQFYDWVDAYVSAYHPTLVDAAN